MGTELQLITFNQTSAKDLLEKLRREIDRIENPAERQFAVDHVTNGFCTAWHLHEWLWDAIREQPQLKATVLDYRGIDDEGIDDQSAFGSALARRFVPLKICRIIATSAKHAHVIVQPESPRDVGSEFQDFDVIGGKQSVAKQDPLSVSSTPVRSIPMVVIMGRAVAAARLLREIDDYWVNLIYECGVEERQ